MQSQANRKSVDVSKRVAARRKADKSLLTSPFKGALKCQKCTAVHGKKKRGGGTHTIYVYVNAKTNRQEVRCTKHL